MNTRCCL